ncbi:HAD family hydrolase [Mesoterricola silvestris]|uniref:Hydrolase n=1 Tax=Mesoterricola silvestris TaxID=2927979 RepID=A0AA48GVI6_9BACT|nr:HAD family phosphatase [Mesoterricola silvestris]BDU72601.1 hydrolase [Mesoterricola silvestris]
MPHRPAILFDLGGVLIDWDPRHLYRQVYGVEETEFFLANVCTPAWNLALDGGRPFAEAIREKQASWPDYREAIDWWWSRWEDMLNGPIPGTVEILEELKDLGLPLFALTNWSAETFPLARKHYPFLDWFQEIVVSGREGVVKPDPAIFRLAALRCGIPMEGSVFIDDSRANVDAAAALGFDAIRFTGAGALRRELEARGCLSAGGRAS